MCADVLPCVYGPSKEHDLPVWTRHLSDVWGPHARVPDLPQADRKTHTSVLISQKTLVHNVVVKYVMNWTWLTVK